MIFDWLGENILSHRISRNGNMRARKTPSDLDLTICTCKMMLHHVLPAGTCTERSRSTQVSVMASEPLEFSVRSRALVSRSAKTSRHNKLYLAVPSRVSCESLCSAQIRETVFTVFSSHTFRAQSHCSQSCDG